ncbi:pectinesterase-like [Andrographis paniculata]|uniref:pectinesterase-like n=1 Tax=Andrographis paniculata TaxID=175694 RepID=UPI0021E94B6E|nr:pectinesterase-like [Andrographis paniculata]
MSKLINTPLSSFIVFLFSYYICCSRQDAMAADGEITKKGIREWCSTTPHPDTCNYFVTHDPDPISSQEDFRTRTIQAAMDRAVDAQSRAVKLGFHGSQIVDRDCSSLVDDTIAQLNTTLHSIRTNASYEVSDFQTWLSAAMTNVEICNRLGFDYSPKFGNFKSPVLLENVSELIRNSLAANGALLGNDSDDKHVTRHGFPKWMTSRDRRLVQNAAAIKSQANAVVSLDGSGQFTSIQAAIDYAVSERVGSGRVVVYVKTGVYTENVLINRTMSNVTLVGDGIRRTVISGNRSSSGGFTTHSSATVGIDAAGFMARGITFRNTAGAAGGQAAALRSASDLSVFYACAFEGYQDTLFVQAQRQFFKHCVVYGTVDFIFGNAAVVFQNCVIYVRRPLLGQANTIVAQGRGDPFQNTGVSIQYCRIHAAPDLEPVVGSVRTYLGRPWQEYSRTVVMQSYLDDLVAPEGWSRWGDSDFALTTLYYGEYENFGPGASTAGRVNWTGYHVLTNPKEVAGFTVSGLISGGAWLPRTGVPFTAGLLRL